MKKIRFLYRPPAGLGFRTLLATYIMATGAGYFLILWLGSPLTTSYAIQSDYAPLWVYGATLLAVGLGLALSRRHRSTWWARGIAGAGLVAVAFIVGTWAQAGAWTGVLGYLVHIWACLLEISFVDE